ncbi:MAG TPA: dimethylarginine dimethylaminohydrolase [Pseudolysinimonas sp.]
MSPLSRRLVAAFATSAIVAAATYLVTTLLYFAASGSTAAALAQILLYFALPAVTLFVLLGVVLLLERARRIWLLVILTLVAVLLAVWVGVLLTLLVEGNPVSGALLAYVIGAALGFGLIFEVVAVLLVGLAGRRLFGAILRPRRGQRIAMVRMPAPTLADGQLTHQKRVPVDAELAVRQWRDYTAALEGAGWTVEQVDPADELPDSVFVEDLAVVIDGTAVLGYPGAESRRGELEAVREALRGRGYDLKPITWPGTLDGGDVLQLGSTIFVGRGTRTNAEGIRQLREIAAALGRTVVAVPLPKVLHLKTAVTALPDGTVLGLAKGAGAIPAGTFERFLAVPEPEGAHVVVLASDTVMIAASAPETAKLITDLGYRTVIVDISEFEKLEGSVTCLSILLP